ncbi:Rho GTPase-activating protein 6 [Gaertneriomyces sp. JEL0708]|nr:Rho GTPase-activating protein 6 [Gaertneriomyces sp. JEL0708]
MSLIDTSYYLSSPQRGSTATTASTTTTSDCEQVNPLSYHALRPATGTGVGTGHEPEFVYGKEEEEGGVALSKRIGMLVQGSKKRRPKSGSERGGGKRDSGGSMTLNALESSPVESVGISPVSVASSATSVGTSSSASPVRQSYSHGQIRASSGPLLGMSASSSAVSPMYLQDKTAVTLPRRMSEAQHTSAALQEKFYTHLSTEEIRALNDAALKRLNAIFRQYKLKAVSTEQLAKIQALHLGTEGGKRKWWNKVMWKKGKGSGDKDKDRDRDRDAKTSMIGVESIDDSASLNSNMSVSPQQQQTPSPLQLPLPQSLLVTSVAIHPSLPHQRIPTLIYTCTQHLLNHGMQTVGVFRVNGSERRIAALTKVFETPPYGIDADLTGYSVYDIADMLKRYLRGLGEPLLTGELYREFLKCLEIPEDEFSTRVRAVRLLLLLLPPPFLLVLTTLMDLFNAIITHPETQMNAHALGRIFSPVLLRPRVSSKGQTQQGQAQLGEMEKGSAVLEWMVGEWRSMGVGVWCRPWRVLDVGSVSELGEEEDIGLSGMPETSSPVSASGSGSLEMSRSGGLVESPGLVSGSDEAQSCERVSPQAMDVPEMRPAGTAGTGEETRRQSVDAGGATRSSESSSKDAVFSFITGQEDELRHVVHVVPSVVENVRATIPESNEDEEDVQNLERETSVDKLAVVGGLERKNHTRRPKSTGESQSVSDQSTTALYPSIKVNPNFKDESKVESPASPPTSPPSQPALPPLRTFPSTGKIASTHKHHMPVAPSKPSGSTHTSPKASIRPHRTRHAITPPTPLTPTHLALNSQLKAGVRLRPPAASNAPTRQSTMNGVTAIPGPYESEEGGRGRVRAYVKRLEMMYNQDQV